jgi:hypothetical protein
MAASSIRTGGEDMGYFDLCQGTTSVVPLAMQIEGGFSRWGLANRPQGLKPLAIRTFTARLKSCPDTNLAFLNLSQLLSSWVWGLRGGRR